MGAVEQVSDLHPERERIPEAGSPQAGILEAHNEGWGLSPQPILEACPRVRWVTEASTATFTGNSVHNKRPRRIQGEPLALVTEGRVGLGTRGLGGQRRGFLLNILLHCLYFVQ